MQRQLQALAQQTQLLKRRMESLEEIFLGGLDPRTDPSPVDFGRVGGQLGSGLGTVIDPPPEDLFNVRLIDLIRKLRGGNVDPAPEDLVNVRVKDLFDAIPGGGVVDPAPEDLSRLDKPQLEARLTEIDVARQRLDKLQTMLKEQLAAR